MTNSTNAPEQKMSTAVTDAPSSENVLVKAYESLVSGEHHSDEVLRSSYFSVMREAAYEFNGQSAHVGFDSSSDYRIFSASSAYSL